MMMRLITFASLLASLQIRDANNSTPALAADALTAAARVLWETPIPLPDAVQAAMLPYTTPNLITNAQVGNGSFQRFFDVDPRVPSTTWPGFRRIPVRHTDATGIYLDFNPCWSPTSPQVFCLYRPAAPRYTSASYDSGKTYQIDDLALAADGHVYRCLIAGTSGTAPLSPIPAYYSDATSYTVGNKVLFGWKAYACAVNTTPGQSPSLNPASWTLQPWQLQPVPLAMTEALKWGARAEKKRDLGQFDEADKNSAYAQYNLDSERLLFVQSFPWAIEA